MTHSDTKTHHSEIDPTTLMGIDYGETNIGVALGRNGLSVPIKIINGKHERSAINELIKIALENKVQKFILGLPLTAENKETRESLKIRRFAKLLRTSSKLPVETVNEYRSTIEATEQNIEEGVPQKKRRMSDNVSAALILKRYYASKA